MISVANAPVSYGAFELTIGINPDVPNGLEILDLVQAAGYSGIDLGPVGYLGSPEEIANNLEKRNLGLAGGYLEIPLHNDKLIPNSLIELNEMLDVFDAATATNQHLKLPPPRPTIAVQSLPERRFGPGRAAKNPELGFTDEQWSIFALNANLVVNICRERGYRAVFHNESGTNVEAPWELEKVIELTSFDICLDTGHFLVGGGEPVNFFTKHANRIGHLHFKSADLEKAKHITDLNLQVEEVWKRKVFSKITEGALDLKGMVRAVFEKNFQGWIVIEQDIFPSRGSLLIAQNDQIANRQALISLGI